MPRLAMQRDTMQGDGCLPALYRKAMRRKGEAPRRAPKVEVVYDCTRKYTGAHGPRSCLGQLEPQSPLKLHNRLHNNFQPIQRKGQYLGHFAAISIPVGSASKIDQLTRWGSSTTAAMRSATSRTRILQDIVETLPRLRVSHHRTSIAIRQIGAAFRARPAGQPRAASDDLDFVAAKLEGPWRAKNGAWPLSAMGCRGKQRVACIGGLLPSTGQIRPVSRSVFPFTISHRRH